MFQTTFTLEKAEIKDAVIKSGSMKKHTRMSIIQTVLATIAAALIAYQIYQDTSLTFFYALFVLCAIIIAIAWIMPNMECSKVVKRNINREIDLKVDDDNLTFCFKDSEPVDVPLDGTHDLIKTDKSLVFMMSGAQIIIIPLRVLADNPQVVEKIEAGAKESSPPVEEENATESDDSAENTAPEEESADNNKEAPTPAGEENAAEDDDSAEETATDEAAEDTAPEQSEEEADA